MTELSLDLGVAPVRRARARLLPRHRVVSLAVIALSCAITGAMSLLFFHAVSPEMMATGFTCAVVIDRIVARLTRHYRFRLAEANDTLEHRVRERTAELEQANRALRDELTARDRMAIAGSVAAGVSHEIRSPLGVIQLAADEVGELLDPSTPPDVRALITDINDAAERIAVILRDLSSVARPVDDPVGPVDLGPAIDSAARLARYRFEGRCITLDRPPLAVPPVLGNASRLVQVVLNLLANAARATRTDAPNTIRISGHATESHVVLAISDTGAGMSEATRARLFEPFFTTGATTGGTGLGLTICRSIVERMGGTIAIASTLGEGTTVSITLVRAAS